MTSKSAASAKLKVTASLNPGLVKQIDEFVKETNADSRSQLIEDALEKWCREQKRRKIEKQIETIMFHSRTMKGEKIETGIK